MCMKLFRVFAIVMIPLLIVGCSMPAGPPPKMVAEAATASEVLERMTSAYRALTSYKSKGHVTADIDRGSIKMSLETSFTILLKKPNLYLISWNQANMPMPGMGQSGAVWSDGTQPYLYMGIMNSYSKMNDDAVALGGATGISAGAANTIPSFFFSKPSDGPASVSRLTNLKLESPEKIGDDECYVVSGSSAVSKQEMIWVSKSNYLIRKFYRSIEPPEGGRQMPPEMTDVQLDDALKLSGQDVTDENRQKMKEMVNSANDLFKSTSMKGSFTEIHEDISSPRVQPNAFQFELPKGSILRESMFGGLPDMKK